MEIALVHRTHRIPANLTFATAGQKINAPEYPIHVQLDNVNVTRMINVHLQEHVRLENAYVSNFKPPKLYYFYCLSGLRRIIGPIML